jgi:hypothetical protein
MLVAERVEVPFIGALRERQRVIEASGGDQRLRQQAALAMCARMVGSVAPLGARQQILARQHRHRPFVLPPQRGFERLAGDDSEIDQVIADTPAEMLLERQRILDVGRGCEPLSDQQLTEKHKRSLRTLSLAWHNKQCGEVPLFQWCLITNF